MKTNAHQIVIVLGAAVAVSPGALCLGLLFFGLNGGLPLFRLAQLLRCHGSCRFSSQAIYEPKHAESSLYTQVLRYTIISSNQKYAHVPARVKGPAPKRLDYTFATQDKRVVMSTTMLSSPRTVSGYILLVGT